MNHEPSIIVIGVGNPLRGDDGVGWYAVDRLMELFKSSEIEFIKCRELLPEISETISQRKFVIFIDVAVDTESGIVAEKKVAPAKNFSSLETHQLDPAGILAFSKALYGNVPKAMMLTVRGESFVYHEGLSKEVRDVSDKLVQRAKGILKKWIRA